MTEDPALSLTPPDDDLVLTPPEPVAPVGRERAKTLVPIDEAKRGELDERAGNYVRGLAELDPRSPEFLTKIGDITTLGEAEIRSSAHVANRMLNRSVAALADVRGEGGDAQKRVAGGLLDLRRTVEDLDPKDIGKVTGRRLLSFLPFGNSLRNFVNKYQFGRAAPRAGGAPGPRARRRGHADPGRPQAPPAGPHRLPARPKPPQRTLRPGREPPGVAPPRSPPVLSDCSGHRGGRP